MTELIADEIEPGADKARDTQAELDEMFRDLEVEVTRQFTVENTLQIWGGEVASAEPESTIKSSVMLPPGGVPADASADESIAEVETNMEATNVSVMLSIHSDGSTSMTMPGASVTLTPRRTSVTTGGEYEIGEVLGIGGMGMVNVARQASLDRRIVVKSIRPEYADRMDAQEKFITEALATGSLDHPNVVPIHDMGVGEDGHLFYVMKEVKGENWRLSLPKMSESENIDVLLRVCDAVACAHDKGIIHRDLKPENIMLGDYGEVLVMDWGLAAAVSPNAKAAHLTDASACAGTPSFMAPEMARGLAHDLGPWSDQYLLGAILFNILTGRPPHPGKTAQEGVLNAANNLIVPSDRKDEWMNVARRAMHTLPHKRYPSVKAFQRALLNCRVHHESITLANKGDEHLAEAKAGGGHDLFNRAINSYEQALVLWKENGNARAKLREARYAYAEQAFSDGDYGLVVSLLEKTDEQREQELAANAREEMRLIEARRRRVRLFGMIAVGALMLVALVSAVAYFIISQQAEAERSARAEAESQRRVAEVRTEEAVQQRSIADEQRAVAEEQRQKAVEALSAAEEARAAEAMAKDLQLREQSAKLAAEEQARQRAEEALRAREEIQRLGYLEDNTRWVFDADEAVARQKREAEKHGVPIERTLNLGNAGLQFNLIPSGYYVMGSPPRDPARNNDEYLHEVELTRPFYMGVTEVTRAQWREVIGMETLADLDITEEESEKALRHPDGDQLAQIRWRLRPIAEGEANLPATGVSYSDIVEVFLPALQERIGEQRDELRLPTEAEWEWAVRAGSGGHFYTGDTQEDLDACAWYERNAEGETQPVGGKEPNAWGMYDMIGNAFEFTLDAYDSLFYLRSPRTDPVNLDDDVNVVVTRGGSYFNAPRTCRMSYRSTYMHRKNRYASTGFRLVLGPAVGQEQ